MTTGSLQRRLARACEGEGLDPSDAQIGQLALYLQLLQRWNAVHNLTGLQGEAPLVDRGVIDSLRALPLLPSGVAGLDVGSGAGFPAIPLAVLEPDRSWVLVEPRRKRVSFLEEVRRQLSLGERLTVRRARLEELDTRAALITSRAVGKIATEVARHLTPGGVWVVAITRAALDGLLGAGGVAGLVPGDHRCAAEGCWSSLHSPGLERGRTGPSRGEKGA